MSLVDSGHWPVWPCCLDMTMTRCHLQTQLAAVTICSTYAEALSVAYVNVSVLTSTSSGHYTCAQDEG